MSLWSKVLLGFAFCASSLFAHFQTILVDKSVISQGDKNNISLKYEFTHPFEQQMMDMKKPKEAGVFCDGKKISLLDKLKEHKKDGFSFWSTNYSFKEPCVYQFYVDPEPYFEPAEDKFIQHQTKTIVDAFDAGEGWDEPIGLKAEIIPFTRPYSLYTGNIFSAQVLYKGKPMPNVEIEVEFYNTKNLKAPNDTFIAQVVKTDNNGMFHFVPVFDGWWGFAALIDDDTKIKKDGKNYNVELGAVLWLKTEGVK